MGEVISLAAHRARNAARGRVERARAMARHPAGGMEPSRFLVGSGKVSHRLSTWDPVTWCGIAVERRSVEPAPIGTPECQRCG